MNETRNDAQRMYVCRFIGFLPEVELLSSMSMYCARLRGKDARNRANKKSTTTHELEVDEHNDVHSTFASNFAKC